MANLGFPTAAAAPRRPLQRTPVAPTVFESLLAFKWRDVEVPITSIRVSLAHELVSHRYYGVDGVNLEDTGLDGLKIDVVIPLFNAMAAGKSESWNSTRPFPELFLNFWAAFRDKTDGDLQHPLLGIIKCKSHQINFPIDADKREGTEVTASFAEQTPLIDDGTTSSYAIIGEATQAAADLDASLDDIRDKAPSVTVPTESFASLMGKVAGFFDTLNVAAQRIANTPAQIMFNIHKVQSAVERLRDATLWPVIDACERLRAAVLGLKSGSSQSKRIRVYVTRTSMTLGMIANTLKADIGDIMSLNQNLLRDLQIPQATVVRYFG